MVNIWLIGNPIINFSISLLGIEAISELDNLVLELYSIWLRALNNAKDLTDRSPTLGRRY
jgi:hypothetical protein